MSSQVEITEVREEVKQLVSDIIAKNHFKRTCKTKYYAGSQAGDGYSTKTYAVDISNDKTSINLFIKCSLSTADMNNIFTDTIYATEIYFYKTIYPTYKEFLESKGVTDGFQNVPVCYGFNDTKRSEVLALENLRTKGLTLFDRFTYMNDEHLKLVLRTLAKFHAVSFALKAQRKELYEEFCKHTPNILVHILPDMVSNAVKGFIEKLDGNDDKDILDRCENLDSKVTDNYLSMSNDLTDYSILLHGDGWVNNLMILYENEDREHPKDVILVDWQCVSPGSPINDLIGLFYCVASKEAVENYKLYQQIYHEELSRRIKELGSDPEVLYPRSVFEKEWINYGLSTLGMSLLVMKIMLTKSKDAPNVEDPTGDKDARDMFKDVLHDEEQFLMRAKYIARHMIDIGVL